MSETISTRKRLDPWAEAMGGAAGDGRDNDPAHADTASREPAWFLNRLRWFLGFRPLGTFMTAFGLLYAAVVVAMFARRMFDEPRAASSTLMYDGIALILAWLVLPPLWFSFDYWVLAKSPAAREAAEKHHQHCRHVWLAALVAMAIFSRA